MRLQALSVFFALTATALSGEGLVYPESPRGDTAETLHGTEVADPYRWLEDENSAATAAWVAAQNKLTSSHLAGIPQRESIRTRLTELYDHERFGTPFAVAGRYFFSRNTGLQNQSVLYTARSLDAEPTVLLDPNALSEDGTVALSDFEVSDDGKLLAYAISRSGSDWREWRVRNINSGRDLPDRVEWSKFSGAAWSDDHLGFYYSRYDQPAEGREFSAANTHQKVFYHRLGTPQTEDPLIYQRPDHPKWGFDARPTDDGRYLIIRVREGAGSGNALFYKDLKTADAPVVELIQGFEAHYIVIGSEGDTLWLRTDSGAPRGRIIAVDLTKPGREHWKTLVRESTDTLRDVALVGDQFVATYMHDASSLVRRYQIDGSRLGDLKLPGLGTIRGLSGEREDRETFYSFGSFTVPPTIYRHDFDSGESSVYRKPSVGFDPSLYATRQVFYKSKDGTRIPMFIVSKRELAKNGANPTLLYGYGGFKISMMPRFSSTLIAWLELGGVYAVANLRGGGEYGEDWHAAGMRRNKQNVFDDFIAAGEWLIENKITNSAKLAISGGSNGGLLVGACMTQRPELFAAALPAVGVMDMLRFHKFTIGWAWIKEYGDPGKAGDFAALHAYSPLHNLSQGTAYPATLITTGDHDDRVVPAHSFKFAAALQHAHRGETPVLIRIETKAGHGSGKPTDKRIAEAADRWAFLVKALSVEL